MALTNTSPFAGLTMAGFSTPTYTLTADLNPAINGVQYAVTGIGGTQANVVVHSASKPFTISIFKPTVIKAVGQFINGILKNNPKNTYKVITRKGVIPVAGAIDVAKITTIFEVPAGADVNDQENLRAMCSAHFGYITSNGGGIGATILSGLI